MMFHESRETPNGISADALVERFESQKTVAELILKNRRSVARAAYPHIGIGRLRTSAPLAAQHRPVRILSLPTGTNTLPQPALARNGAEGYV